MINLEAIFTSPTFILALLMGFAWLIRLESKAKTNEKDIEALKDDLSNHKLKQSEQSERIYGKIEQLQKDISKIDSSVSRIEGKLEHFKDE